MSSRPQLRVRIDQATSDRLDQLRLATGRSTSELVVLAVGQLKVGERSP